MFITTKKSLSLIVREAQELSKNRFSAYKDTAFIKDSYLYTTDFDTALSAPFVSGVCGQISVTALRNAVRSLSTTGDVHVSVSGGGIVLSQGLLSLRVAVEPGQGPEEETKALLQTVGDSVSVPLETLLKVRYAVSDDSLKRSLQGVFVDTGDGALASSNGHRLAVVSDPLLVSSVYKKPNVGNNRGVIISPELLGSAHRLRKDGAKVRVFEEKTLLDSDTMTIVSKNVEMWFPDYRALLLEKSPGMSFFSLQTSKENMAALKAASKHSNMLRPLNLSPKEGGLSLTVREVPLPDTTAQPAMLFSSFLHGVSFGDKELPDIGVYASYLIEALEQFPPNKEVLLTWEDGHSPIHLYSSDDPSQAVVMPISR